MQMSRLPPAPQASGGTTSSCGRRSRTALRNCLPIAAIIDEEDLLHARRAVYAPKLASMDQIKRILRPTDVPDTGLLCDLLCGPDPDKDIVG